MSCTCPVLQQIKPFPWEVISLSGSDPALESLSPDQESVTIRVECKAGVIGPQEWLTGGHRKRKSTLPMTPYFLIKYSLKSGTNTAAPPVAYVCTK